MSAICRAAMQACLVTALAGAARAEPVVFDNSSGVFDWGWFQLGSEFGGKASLEIRRPPDQQDDAFDVPTHIQRFNDPGWTSRDPMENGVASWSQSAIASSGTVVLEHWGDWGWPSTHTYHIPRLFQPGDVVGLGEDFQDTVTIWCSLLDTDGQYVDHNFWEGDGGYLGIQLSIDGWTHYGWVKVTRECGAALAWAYETTPGAPISVPLPAPGPAAIWFVCVAMQGRPRRT